MQKAKKAAVYLFVFLFGLAMGQASETKTVEVPIEKVVEKRVEVPVENVIEKTVRDETCDKAISNLGLCSQIVAIGSEVIQQCPKAINAVAIGDARTLNEVTIFVNDARQRMNALTDQIQK